eukprot:476653-Rhodomonas_salina.8
MLRLRTIEGMLPSLTHPRTALPFSVLPSAGRPIPYVSTLVERDSGGGASELHTLSKCRTSHSWRVAELHPQCHHMGWRSGG